MQTINLLGSEEVSRAASRMASAADSIASSVSYLDSILHQHQAFLDDWLLRLDGILSDRISDFNQTIS